MLYLCRDSHYIDKFTIYGERHSGTNFLESCIKQQFGLDITYFYGFKHWMGFAKPEVISYNRQVLFIGIVRNPYDWLAAFYNAPHHVPRFNSLNINTFLTNEWYSIDCHNNEIMYDRNFTSKPYKRYHNIFEMRRTKYIYLSQVMPLIAKNYILLSYDSFLKNHTNYLNIIGNRYHLKTINKPPIPVEKKSYNFDLPIKNLINSNLDWTLEESLGYTIRN